MPSLENKGTSIAPSPDTMNLPAKMPRIPDAVVERFPDMEDYQSSLDKWWGIVVGTISENNEESANVINQNNQGVTDLKVSVDGLSAEITELSEIVVTGDAILARRIVTVSAMAGVASNLTISPVAPGAPALNDYWIDTSVPLTPVTYKWDGATWVEVLTPISVAGVQTEATARATADGYLEGKYTLTVVAGDVVTGMNITSASGPGVNVSEVTFQADKFQIYSGTTKKVMFVADAINDVVKLADTFVVDAANAKVYIGAGNYANADTAWYVDDTGRMSLTNKLTWDGATLSIDGNGTFSGALSAATGTFSGSLDVGSGDNHFVADLDGVVVGNLAGARYIRLKNWAAFGESSVGIDVHQVNYDLRLGDGAFSFGLDVTFGAVGEAIFGVYTPSFNPGAGIDLYFNAGTFALGVDVGGIPGIIVNGSPGIDDTFDPTTLTSMTFQAGILTARS